MKKFLLAIGALFMCLGASAQGYLLDNPNNHGYFGIRGSYNLSLPSKVKSISPDQNYTTKTKIFGKGSGFNIGVIYNQPLVANLYLEPGVTLAYTTESFKNTMDMFPAFFDKAMKHSSARKFSLEIPVQVGYHFDFTPDISLAISTGPVLKIGLVDDYYLTTEDLPVIGTVHKSGSLYGENGPLRRVDCAWRVGVGFNIATNYYVGVSGDIGLVNMLKQDNDGAYSMHENAFNVSVGYNF
ncbi:MAG: porin family protein [Lachnospiraceae bacterium]|nr:porin family protein [Lachnospiraceae bacterium]